MDMKVKWAQAGKVLKGDCDQRVQIKFEPELDPYINQQC